MEVLRYETPGIAKEIDEGAIDLVFDVFQEGIYAYPIKSFVREAISNGLDAIVEKQIHQKIAAGDPVEKYYRQEFDDKLLKDSAYDPDYYDDKYLSQEDDAVVVKYLMSSEKRRHTIKIIDQGIGLGGERLSGFFRIG